MNLSLAPIQGMTLSAYRNAFSKIFGGIDTYYSPFITTCDIKKASPLLFKDLLPEINEAEVKVIPQLLSNNGSDFKFFASTLVDMGYKEINWNIGCPFPMVTNKKKGSGLLPYTDLIKQFLDSACADHDYTITVKMRLGLHNPEEGMGVMNLLNQYPLGGVIIHPRTGIQMYTGHVDLDAFEALNTSCKHEITYNGDIFNYEDFIRIQQRFPSINNFMLGRGALRDPFLPSIIKGQIIPPSKKINMIRHFHDEIYNHYKNRVSGDQHLCDKMTEFWTYMSVHTDMYGKFMKKIKKCRSSNEYLDVVSQILSTTSTWRDTPL